MYLTDLASVLRKAGLNVIEVSGWKTRGHGGMNKPRGIIWHHTATPARAEGNYPSLGTVTHGRKDLKGPLANLGLGRDGTWYVIAAGQAWHAGSGSYPGLSGNIDTIGIEAEHPGTAGHPWPKKQLESYRKGSAALAKHYGIPASKVIGHKEWTTRKVDPYGLNMSVERSHVAKYMSGKWQEVDDVNLSDRVKLSDWTCKQMGIKKGSTLSVAGLLQYAAAGGFGTAPDIDKLRRETDKLKKELDEVRSMIEFLVEAVKTEQAKAGK